MQNIIEGEKYPIHRPGHWGKPVPGIAVKVMSANVWSFKIGLVRCGTYYCYTCKNTKPNYKCKYSAEFVSVNIKDITSTWKDYSEKLTSNSQKLSIIQDVFEDSGLKRNLISIKDNMLHFKLDINLDDFLGMVSKIKK
jgi:hypothetical protein